MFKKFLMMLGTYSLCVFVHKTSNVVAHAAAPILGELLDDITP